MLDCLDEPEPIEKPEAFRKQIAHLRSGDSAAKVKRVKLGSPEATSLAETIRGFRISVDSEVSKQRKATGREYIVEQGTLISNGHILIIVAVSRN